jgi:hypothetical protein
MACWPCSSHVPGQQAASPVVVQNRLAGLADIAPARLAAANELVCCTLAGKTLKRAWLEPAPPICTVSCWAVKQAPNAPCRSGPQVQRSQQRSWTLPAQSLGFLGTLQGT